MTRRKSADPMEYIRKNRPINETRECRVEGCTTKRVGISNYCKAHAERNRVHGHPEAVALQKNDYAMAAVHVSEFLALHEDHPGVQAAYAFADRWLALGRSEDCVPAEVPGGIELQRIAYAGVTGVDVINEMLAVWLYLKWASRTVSWADHPETVRRQIGVRILQIAPRAVIGIDKSGHKHYRRISGGNRSEVGHYFCTALGAFAANAMQAIADGLQARKNATNALRLPFEDKPVPPNVGAKSTIRATYRSRSIHARR